MKLVISAQYRRFSPVSVRSSYGFGIDRTRSENSKKCGHVVVFPYCVTSNTASKMASYTRYASGKFAKSKRCRRNEKKSRIVI